MSLPIAHDRLLKSMQIARETELQLYERFATSPVTSSS